jgi:hypothetical protein
MSKAIRLYMHHGRAAISHRNYNYHTGMEIVKYLMEDEAVRILATGSEEGAMVLHYEFV